MRTEPPVSLPMATSPRPQRTGRSGAAGGARGALGTRTRAAGACAGAGAYREQEPPELVRVVPLAREIYSGPDLRVGVGQGGGEGALQATIMQMAQVASAVGNGGRLMKPLLVSRVTDAAGNTIEQFAPTVRRPRMLKPSDS